MSTLRFLSLLLSCWVCASAAGGVRLAPDTVSLPLSSQVMVLEDASGGLDLAAVQAQAARMQPAAVDGAAINFGFSASIWWLRIDLDADPGAARDWLLEVAYPALDRVDLFAPDGTRLVVGDRLPFAERPVAHRHFVLPLRLPEAGGSTVWLRVASEGALAVPLRLWRADAFWPASQASYAMLAAYFGMLFALILYHLLAWLASRDALHFHVVLLGAALIVGQLSLNGLGNQYFWPDWPAWGDAAFSVGFAGAGLAGALFTRGFLQTRRLLPRLDGAVLGLAALFALCALLPLVAPYRLAAILTSLTVASFALIAVLVGQRAWHERQPGAKTFLMAWIALAGGVAVVALRNLGLLPATVFAEYALQIGTALHLLLLSQAMADRRDAMVRDREASQAAELGAGRQLVSSLRRTVAGLESRLIESTRETDTARARLRENERQLHAMAHTDNLTGLANRLLFQARLEQSMQQARRTNGQIALLLLDIDRFKAINDRYGQAIGDEVLRHAATRFRASVRAVDTVARLVGDEFAMVLTGLGSGADAELAARKIIAVTGEPLRVLGVPMEIGVSIGIALFPAGNASSAELLHRADQAVRAAKAAGGGYRVFAA